MRFLNFTSVIRIAAAFLTAQCAVASATTAMRTSADSITTLINEPRVFQPLANDEGTGLVITALTTPETAHGSRSWASPLP